MSERNRLETLLGAVDRLVREPLAEAEVERDTEAFLARGGLPPRDVEATAAVGKKRLLLYRKLVLRGLRAAIRAEIPRAAARLGARFDADVDAFVSACPPRSHYLRDVAFEFVDWAAPGWATDAGVPSYLADLARHELSLFTVGSAADPDGACGPADLELERSVRFHPSVRLFRYAHAVHELSAELGATDVPAQTPTILLGYRDPQSDVRYLALSDLAGAVVERLVAGETLEMAVRASCEAFGRPLSDDVLAGTARVLTDLVERGAVLGAGGPGRPSRERERG
jgi:hypothetical protein